MSELRRPSLGLGHWRRALQGAGRAEEEAALPRMRQDRLDADPLDGRRSDCARPAAPGDSLGAEDPARRPPAPAPDRRHRCGPDRSLLMRFEALIFDFDGVLLESEYAGNAQLAD